MCPGGRVSGEGSFASEIGPVHTSLGSERVSSPPSSDRKATSSIWSGGIPFRDGSSLGHERSGRGALCPGTGTCLGGGEGSGSCPMPLGEGPAWFHSPPGYQSTEVQACSRGLSLCSEPARAPRSRAACPGSEIWPSPATMSTANTAFVPDTSKCSLIPNLPSTAQ